MMGVNENCLHASQGIEGLPCYRSPPEPHTVETMGVAEEDASSSPVAIQPLTKCHRRNGSVGDRQKQAPITANRFADDDDACLQRKRNATYLFRNKPFHAVVVLSIDSCKLHREELHGRGHR